MGDLGYQKVRGEKGDGGEGKVLRRGEEGRGEKGRSSRKL